MHWAWWSTRFQAMVTHELLGTIKGANAEVDMLKAALIDMTAQRDARMDMSALAAMGAGSGMSAADMEEFQTLKVISRGEEPRGPNRNGQALTCDCSVAVNRTQS